MCVCAHVCRRPFVRPEYTRGARIGRRSDLSAAKLQLDRRAWDMGIWLFILERHRVGEWVGRVFADHHAKVVNHVEINTRRSHSTCARPDIKTETRNALLLGNNYTRGRPGQYAREHHTVDVLHPPPPRLTTTTTRDVLLALAPQRTFFVSIIRPNALFFSFFFFFMAIKSFIFSKRKNLRKNEKK